MIERQTAKIPTAALIGVGGFGQFHLDCLSALARERVVQLAAVADPAPERVPGIFEQLTGAGVRWFANYLDLLTENPDIDLVIICTPIPLHEEMVLAALEQTEATIYLEKPPAATLPQLRRLIAADPTQRVHVGFQMGRRPVFRQLKDWIESGRLGKIQRIAAGAVWPRGDQYYQRASWAGRMVTSSGQAVFDGPATNALAHLVHGVMHLAGGSGYARPTQIAGELYRARPIESYDAACMAGRLDTGVEFAISVAHCARVAYPWAVQVQGDRACARITDEGRRIEADFAPARDPGEADDSTSYRESIVRMCRRQPPVNSLVDCLGYAEVTFGALCSFGGIHQIDPGFVQRADAFYHVHDVILATDRMIGGGKLWSEQGIPWARTPRATISSRELATISFQWRGDSPPEGGSASPIGSGLRLPNLAGI